MKRFVSHFGLFNSALLLGCFLFSVSVSADPIDSNARISLDLENVPITRAVTLIANQQNLNVVLAGDVEGTVTVKLDDVDVATALQSILVPNGYNYYFNGKVIVIKSNSTEAAGELTTQVITLKYINANTAAKALESLKSAKGKIVVLDQTTVGSSGTITFSPNKIAVTDNTAILDAMHVVVKSIDVAERLISIGVKIIETKIDNSQRFGFLWPSSVSAVAGGLVGDSSSGSNSNRSLGQMQLASGDWAWGTLSVKELGVVLDMLSKDGKSKLISDPHLTTLENHEAEIKVETVVPIPTVNRFSEAAATQDILTYQDVEVGISVTVTPRINDDGKITLDVFPQVEDIIGYVGNEQSQAPIRSERSIRTKVTVANGETVALGGLLKEDQIDRRQRVPVLGSIPLIGSALFSNSSKEHATTDLIILITPTIIAQ
jgi:type II secretory pathway component GspD/PulD (secretin)